MIILGLTHRGKGEGMPLKKGGGGDIEKDILSCFRKESLAPHLDLNGLGRVFYHLGDDDSA